MPIKKKNSNAISFTRELWWSSRNFIEKMNKQIKKDKNKKWKSIFAKDKKWHFYLDI